ncbi:hypothetical protein FBU59_003361 [Linderina macrospora]|uniref:Uncharacterized protein n=1 Tax=Linderina macrospora TaxID=4868 RepID=A0ACC1J8U7_9FUNG|nr:hypothetical protein FBU59_003361 [Linderina macrospora]
MEYTFVAENTLPDLSSLIYYGDLKNSLEDSTHRDPDYSIEIRGNKHIFLTLNPHSDPIPLLSGKYTGFTHRHATLKGYGGKFKAERIPFGKRWTFTDGLGSWYNWYHTAAEDDVMTLKDHNKNVLATFRKHMFGLKSEGVLTVSPEIPEWMLAMVVVTVKLLLRGLVDKLPVSQRSSVQSTET